MSDTLHIRSLEIVDFKRIKAATIKPDGSPLVIIGGANGQGKSSVLDAVLSALGGAAHDPAEPVRRGGKRAEVTVDLGEYRVAMTHTGRTRSLKVTRPDGAVMPKAQTVLDGLLGAHTVDPVAWLSEKPQQQADTLRALAGIDTSDLDSERAKLYDERTIAGREAKSAVARAAGCPIPENAPDAEVSVAALAERLNEAMQVNRQADEIDSKRKRNEVEIERVKGQILALQEQLKILESERKSLPVAGCRINTDPIREQMAGAEAANTAFRKAAEARRLAAEAKAAEERHAALGLRIEAIDAERAGRIAAGTYPVPGLSVGDAGVMFNGLPLEQASGAERLRVAVAVALAEKPRLRVLRIRDGSLLDRDSLAMLAGLATEHDAEVWIERVGDQDPGAVIIEDGEVYQD